MKLLSLLALLMMTFTISQSSYASDNCTATNDGSRDQIDVSEGTTRDGVEITPVQGV